MTGPILLPALQGRFGEWTYYSAIMPLSEVRKRVGFAHEIHPNKQLGKRIQRQLQDGSKGVRGQDRAGAIADYLGSHDRRFFSAIVVGIYGGEPVWHPFDVSPRVGFDTEGKARLAEQERVGFLELNGTERLFALDGQHRVAGIGRAIEDGAKVEGDILTVLFVPHIDNDEGIARTRRLFVDLNKKAVPVDKKEVIILDEVDLGAILARRLVEEHRWFSRGQVDLERFSNHVPAGSQSLFSIRTLYDVINRLLRSALAVGPEERQELKYGETERLPNNRIDYYYARALSYFNGLARANGQLAEYWERGPESGIAVDARGPNVRNVLFRPVGQHAYASVVAALSLRDGLESALELVRSLPVDMAEPPFAQVVWDPARAKMTGKGLGLATRLLKYMCGVERSQDRAGQLLRDYQAALADDEAGLPARLIRD